MLTNRTSTNPKLGSRKPLAPVCALVAAGFALLTACGSPSRSEAARSSSGSPFTSLNEAARDNSAVVHADYLARLTKRVRQLEGKVIGLRAAIEEAKGKAGTRLVETVDEFEESVKTARAELDTLKASGGTPGWELAKDRATRAIASAERDFDQLAVRFRVSEAPGN